MRQKLKRFRDNETRTNIIQQGKEIFETIKGNWNSDYFKNQQDIVIELGCGNGEYTVGLAEKFTGKNFVGVDIKGPRIWVGSTYAIENDLQNVAFLRTQIQMIDRFFVSGEVSEVWVTFPDPRPRESDAKRRLTSPRFMALYKSILKEDGWVKFKTDDTDIFDYTLDLIESDLQVKNLQYTHDLYNSSLLEEHYGVKTKYEEMFTAKGRRIKYLKFQFLCGQK